ncbi:hypothetical protein BDZ45DRAFT_423022 [Acephala macrosclerotiorum]|nr:hypothetical protein BDZ45DRAFT_423022 [Acephala macrosclerotiorum]
MSKSGKYLFIKKQCFHLNEIIPNEIEDYASEALPALSGDENRSDKLSPRIRPIGTLPEVDPRRVIKPILNFKVFYRAISVRWRHHLCLYSQKVLCRRIRKLLSSKQKRLEGLPKMANEQTELLELILPFSLFFILVSA